MKNTSQRLTRWAWKINEFSPFIKYIRGEENSIADYLSRNSVKDEECGEREASYMYLPIHSSNVTLVCNLNLNTIKEGQSTDKFCQSLKNKLPIQNVIIDEVLYKIISDKKVPIIPHSMESSVIKELHDSPSSGHLGVTKTYKKLLHRVYFPQMKRRVHDYVKTCKICQQVRYENQKPPGFMSSPTVTEPWSTLHLDLMGPYPKSYPGGYTCILVVVDYLTKWTEIFPLRQGKSKEIIKLLETNVFCRYGLPKIIVTDNAKNLISKNFEDCLSQWRIKHSRIPIYTPQINLTERVNRTIKQIIRSYLIDISHSCWAAKLPFDQLAINSSFQESTKFSPAKLFLNREITFPIDLCLQKSETNDDTGNTYNTNAIQEDYAKILSFVVKNLEDAHGKQKRGYDDRHREFSFKVGDLVLMKDVQLSSKEKGIASGLNPLYEGKICKIKNILGNSTYTLSLPNGKTRGPVHITFLRPYHPRPVDEFLHDHFKSPESNKSNEALSINVNNDTLNNVCNDTNAINSNICNSNVLFNSTTNNELSEPMTLPITIPKILFTKVKRTRNQPKVDYRNNGAGKKSKM